MASDCDWLKYPLVRLSSVQLEKRGYNFKRVSPGRPFSLVCVQNMSFFVVAAAAAAVVVVVVVVVFFIFIYFIFYCRHRLGDKRD